MDGRVDGQMDGQTDGQMDCQMDGQNGRSNLQILTAIHKGVNYDFGRFNQIFMVIDRGGISIVINTLAIKQFKLNT